MRRPTVYEVVCPPDSLGDQRLSDDPVRLSMGLATRKKSSKAHLLTVLVARVAI